MVVPLAEAKNHLSSLVARAEQGEQIAITRRGVPVARLLPLADAHAPWLLQLEFTNVLRTACRRGSLPAARAREILDQVGLLPIRIDSSPPAPASLLSLAPRVQLPIATRDDDLAEAAWAAGVGMVSG